MKKYMKNALAGFIVLAVGFGFAWLIGNKIIDGGSYEKFKFALGVGSGFQLFIFISLVFSLGEMPGIGNAQAMSQALRTFNDPKKIVEAATPLKRYSHSGAGFGFVVENIPAILVGLAAAIIGKMM